MANVPNINDPGIAAFEFTRMQLCGSLNAVAGAMRDAATIADQFSQIIRDIPYHPGHPGFMPPNGQFLQLPPAPVPPTPAGGKRKSRATDEDGEGKKKRKTKPKDPNAPKRPASSYLLFQNEIRQELKAKNPHLTNNELLAQISKVWTDMPKEEKDLYEERQKVAKNQYLLNKAAYESRNLAAAAEAMSPPAVQQPAAVKPAAVVTPAPPPAPVVTSSDEESSEESSNDSDSENSDDEAPPPTTKKSRHHASAPVKVESTKEKKSKKSKA